MTLRGIDAAFSIFIRHDPRRHESAFSFAFCCKAGPKLIKKTKRRTPMSFMTPSSARIAGQCAAALICPGANVITLRQPIGATSATLPAARPLQRRPRGDASAARPQQPAPPPGPPPRRRGVALGPLGAVRARAAGRAARSRGVTLEARLPERPRRDGDLAQPRLQAARPSRHLPRLRHPGLPRRRSALR